MTGPRVLLDHRALVLCEKPAGLPTTGDGHCAPGTLEGWLSETRGHPVWAVHQLDRDTSGIVLCALRRGWVKDAQDALARGHKTYALLAHGQPGWDRTAIEARLLRTPQGTVVDETGRPARTTVEVVARGPAAFAATARIETGRTHQVRVHLAHRGHPLLGERRYRTPPCTALPRQALHAWRLSVTVRGDRLEAESPWPDDMVQAARTFALSI